MLNSRKSKSAFGNRFQKLFGSSGGVPGNTDVVNDSGGSNAGVMMRIPMVTSGGVMRTLALMCAFGFMAMGTTAMANDAAVPNDDGNVLAINDAGTNAMVNTFVDSNQNHANDAQKNPFDRNNAGNANDSEQMNPNPQAAPAVTTATTLPNGNEFIQKSVNGVVGFAAWNDGRPVNLVIRD